MPRQTGYIDGEGLDIISPFEGYSGGFARPRMVGVAAALNRLRTLRLHSETKKQLIWGRD